MSNLTDDEIDRITDAQWGKGCAPNQYAAHRAAARAIESAVVAKVSTPAASPTPIDARPLHPNHRPDLRYVLRVLRTLQGAHVPENQWGDVAAAINGMEYIIKRTEEAASAVAPQVDAPRWMPIESAPKDGTHVLIANDAPGSVHPREGYYVPPHQRYDNEPENPRWWRLAGSSEELVHGRTPTHWQPMPAAPSPLQAFANAPLGEGLAAARAVLAASKEAS